MLLKRLKIIITLLAISALMSGCSIIDANTSRQYTLTITVPDETSDLIEPGMNFAVNGTIEGEKTVPDDAVLTVSMIDENGEIIRQTSQTHKNHSQFYLYHPELMYYDESLDPERKELRDFAFTELIVDDEEHPEESIHDATIKCYYSDDIFKTFFIYATDQEHGALGDDGMNYTDHEGNAFTPWDTGKYIIKAELRSKFGFLLGECEKEITVGNISDVLIARFSPPSQKKRALAWADANGFKYLSATLPGYLMPMNGHGYPYDMGLRRLDRISDLAFYNSAHVHMLIYNTTAESNSYKLEHAHVQKLGRIDDKNKFTAYHYDIGEPVLFPETEKEISGNIIPFDDDKNIAVCRIDMVDGDAEENVFYTDCTSVLDTITYKDENTIINVTGKFAVMGAVSSFQLEENEIEYDDYENIYSLKNRIASIDYDIKGVTSNRMYMFNKEVHLERYTTKLQGDSIFEFYHIFDSEDFEKGEYTVTMQPVDMYGNNIGKSIIAYLSIN